MTTTDLTKTMSSLNKMMARRVEMLGLGRSVDIIDSDIAQLNALVAEHLTPATPDWRPTETIAEDFYAL